jgi:hypothetical protein
MATGILGMPSGVLSQQQGTQLIGASNDQARDQALSAGAIAAGAGLLGAPNLREGLAQGLTGFNRGFNTELLANRPKVTPLAGGAFSQITFPDGRVEVMSNEDVKKFLQEQTDTNVLGKMQLAQFNAGLATDKLQKQAEIKRTQENAPILQSTEDLLRKYDQATEIVNSQEGAERVLGITDAQLQGMAPGIAGFFGGDEAANNKFLQGLIVDETLLNTAKTKGAISNAEMSLFKSPMPSLTDNRKEVWKPFVEQRKTLLKAVIDRIKNGVQVPWDAPLGALATAVNPQATPQAVPLAASTAPDSPPANTNVQAASAGNATNTPVTVQSDTDYNALPSGTIFIGPDGKRRKKP